MAVDSDGFPVLATTTVIGPADAIILEVGNKQPPLTIMNRSKVTKVQFNQHPTVQVLTVAGVFDAGSIN